MKKMITAGFTAMLLLAICTGCQGKQVGQEEVLTICVDSQLEQAGQELVNTWEQINEGEKAELVIIPDNAEMAKTRIAELRTEIMSGGGPDVFLLKCVDPDASEDCPVLFSNPEKMMYSDVFLPLDEYVGDAQYMNVDAWNQTILESGRTEEGQLLLPVCYGYGAYAFRTKDIEIMEKLPFSWDEVISGEDKISTEGIAANFFLGFYDVFGKLADYQNETLLLSEEDLLKRVQEAIWFNKKGEEARNMGKFPEAVSGNRVRDSFLVDLENDQKQKHTIFAFPNIDGGVTANITLYTAVNRNTALPEEAFSLLDILFSDEIMCGKGFQTGDITHGSTIGAALKVYGGFLVNDNALQTSCAWIAREDAEAIQKMNSQVSVVRYNSDLDRELQKLYENCYNFGRPGSEEEIKQLVSQTFNILRMRLSE